MRELRRNLIVMSVGLLGLTAAQAADIIVRGPDDDAMKNVRIAVAALTPDSDGYVDEPRIVKAVSEALKPFGYYSASVAVAVEAEKSIVTVTPGRQILLQKPEVTIKGDAKNDSRVLKLVAEIPGSGTPLRHSEYDGFKSSLDSVALSAGYFDAEFEKSRLEVSVKKSSAKWVVVWNSGERWRFGKTSFSGSQIDEDMLQSLIAYEENEPFSAEKSAEFSRRLSQTGWFDSVALTPEFAKAENRELPMKASVTPRAGNEVEVGLGVASDVGVYGQLDWTKPWINRRGHSVQFSTSVSQKEQYLSAQWKLPEKSDPVNDYWLVSTGYKHTDLNDTKSEQITATLSRTHLLPSGWQRTASLTLSQTHFTQAAVDHDTFLLYPGLSFYRVRQRGGVSPFWGDSQRYVAEISRKEWGSGVDFVTLKLQDSILRTFAHNHRFLGRLTVGWLLTNDIDKLPPEKRFFAGGDKSVRGYGYQKISPTDGAGKLIGGSKMVTATAEYQYRVTGSWWGAVFADAGDAVRSVSDLNWKKGYGVGVRWDSPIGPVKIDVAWPSGGRFDRDMQYYLGLGMQW